MNCPHCKLGDLCKWGEPHIMKLEELMAKAPIIETRRMMHCRNCGRWVDVDIPRPNIGFLNDIGDRLDRGEITRDEAIEYLLPYLRMDWMLSP